MTVETITPCAASKRVAVEAPARANPMAGFVALCHLCFAFVPIAAIAFAAFGLDAILAITHQPPAPPRDLMLFKIGCVAIGLAIWGAGEMILRTLLAAQAGSPVVSVFIALGIVVMLLAWALVL